MLSDSREEDKNLPCIRGGKREHDSEDNKDDLRDEVDFEKGMDKAVPLVSNLLDGDVVVEWGYLKQGEGRVKGCDLCTSKSYRFLNHIRPGADVRHRVTYQHRQDQERGLMV